MKLGLLVRFEAKPGYADRVEALLRDAVQLAHEETYMVTWFAFRQGETTFGVFDTFETEEGRSAHLAGRITDAVMEVADTVLAGPPAVTPVDLLSVKLP